MRKAYYKPLRVCDIIPKGGCLVFTPTTKKKTEDERIERIIETIAIGIYDVDDLLNASRIIVSDLCSELPAHEIVYQLIKKNLVHLTINGQLINFMADIEYDDGELMITELVFE